MLKNFQNFPNFALKMSIFRQKKLKIEINWNFTKHEFFALKNVEFCSKIANFAGTKVKVFSKFVKSVKKKFKNPNLFFQKTWIFGGEMKNYWKSAIFRQKMIFFFSKNCQKWHFFQKFQKFCIFRKRKKKKIQKSLNLA